MHIYSETVSNVKSLHEKTLYVSHIFCTYSNIVSCIVTKWTHGELLTQTAERIIIEHFSKKKFFNNRMDVKLNGD